MANINGTSLSGGSGVSGGLFSVTDEQLIAYVMHGNMWGTLHPIFQNPTAITGSGFGTWAIIE